MPWQVICGLHSGLLFRASILSSSWSAVHQRRRQKVKTFEASLPGVIWIPPLGPQVSDLMWKREREARCEVPPS